MSYVNTDRSIKHIKSGIAKISFRWDPLILFVCWNGSRIRLLTDKRYNNYPLWMHFHHQQSNNE